MGNCGSIQNKKNNIIQRIKDRGQKDNKQTKEGVTPNKKWVGIDISSSHSDVDESYLKWQDEVNKFHIGGRRKLREKMLFE